jgi:F-type H+-transporting ATPase subunit epsilon
MTAFAFELVTPERVLWSGEAEAVSTRTEIGEITFLANHEQFVGSLDITVLRIVPASGDRDDAAPAASRTGPAEREDHAEVRAAVHGGFVYVDDNKVVVAAGVAELGDEIDVPRADRALEAAEAAVESEVDSDAVPTGTSDDGAGARPVGPKLTPAQSAVRRARVRLEAAGESTS